MSRWEPWGRSVEGALDFRLYGTDTGSPPATLHPQAEGWLRETFSLLPEHRVLDARGHGRAGCVPGSPRRAGGLGPGWALSRPARRPRERGVSSGNHVAQHRRKMAPARALVELTVVTSGDAVLCSAFTAYLSLGAVPGKRPAVDQCQPAPCHSREPLPWALGILQVFTLAVLPAGQRWPWSSCVFLCLTQALFPLRPCLPAAQHLPSTEPPRGFCAALARPSSWP